jgi:hypothetical protein
LNFLEFLQHTELYHGSKSSEVTGEIRVGERDSGWYGRGFYLTANKDYAKRWGPNIFKMSVPFGNYAEVNHVEQNIFRLFKKQGIRWGKSKFTKSQRCRSSSF